jgi:hypothetical protein
MKTHHPIFAASLTASLITGAASATTVYSNASAPGDSFTEAGTSSQGQAVTGTDFYYNNVRNDGVAGINTNYARSGNGSVYLQTVNGPAGDSSKADFELLASGTALGGNYFAAGSFGTLGELTSLGYDWYRDSSSTNSAGQHPALRILVDADGDLNTTGDRGGLVFEIAYNGSATATTDTWVTEDIFSYNAGDGANLWTFGAGMTFAQEGYGNSLADWVAGIDTIDANSAVLGFSMGVGSGWGPFEGAVDNLVVGFNGSETTYNFEVVPEPGSIALLGLGGLALIRRRRRV